MLARSKTCAIVGLDGTIVDVESDISPGLPAFHVVGLPDAVVQESRERVRSAIRNSGAEFPMRRITVSLAPADLKKTGPAYDLPIAMGLLMSSGQVPDAFSDSLLLGELALNGSLRATQGMLPMVAVGKASGVMKVYVPAENAREAALVHGMEVMPVESLAQLVAHARGITSIKPFDARTAPAGGAVDAPKDTGRWPDLSDVRGQEHAKRAMEVAAAGAHNLLMTGPPGSGKTLLARSLPSILPEMTPDEALEVTKIYSVAVACCPLEVHWYSGVPSALRTTPSRTLDWSVEVRCRGLVRSHLATAVCCSWMSCLSSVTLRWRYCGNRWKTVW